MKVTSVNYFDVSRALYWYCVDNHEGQGSEKYRILSNIGYKPSFSERGVSNEDDSASILLRLERKTICPVELFIALQEFQNGRND